MVDRANAFRQHFDLDEERKYKELNLYVLHIALPHSVHLHLLVYTQASLHPIKFKILMIE
jgi:hypothetical protein